jgi:glyoxylase-like metal-dependent hydrolase (beta-lactamase superfamily II)
MAETIPPHLRRIVADNPSPLTGTGTNTWLVGEGEVAVIDPGPALPAHQAAIMAALQPHERITHIIVTHTHLDHTALARPLASATGAVVMGFGPFDAGRGPAMQALAAKGMPDGGEGIDRDFRPDIALSDGDRVDGRSWSLQAIHTPGHAATHLCLALGDRLFTGDHVMGWSSSLISPPDGDMAAYMASLAKLGTQDWTVAHPGHGPDIPDPATRIATLTAHRRQREAALLDALDDGPMTISRLTAAVYHDTPRGLHRAASRNVLAHVIDLLQANRVTCGDICASDPDVARS